MFKALEGLVSLTGRARVSLTGQVLVSLPLVTQKEPSSSNGCSGPWYVPARCHGYLSLLFLFTVLTFQYEFCWIRGISGLGLILLLF